MSAVTGGPAFPAHGTMGEIVEHGMTLREYFAANAPITIQDAMLATYLDERSIGILERPHRNAILAVLAQMRYDYADAMIAGSAK